MEEAKKETFAKVPKNMKHQIGDYRLCSDDNGNMCFMSDLQKENKSMKPTTELFPCKPDVSFVINLDKSLLAEAYKMGIPVYSLCDSEKGLLGVVLDD